MTYHLVTAATSLIVPSLHPFYMYNCTVAAFTIAVGPYSVELSITLPEDGMFIMVKPAGFQYLYYPWLITVPSSAPGMLRPVTVSSSSAVLTWEAPPPEDLNGHLIGYSINMTKIRTGERLELFSNSTSLTVSNLQSYTVYTCISAAVTNAGRGPFTNSIQIVTLEAGM